MFSFLFSSLTGPGIYPQVVERILQNASSVARWISCSLDQTGERTVAFPLLASGTSTSSSWWNIGTERGLPNTKFSILICTCCLWKRSICSKQAGGQHSCSSSVAEHRLCKYLPGSEKKVGGAAFLLPYQCALRGYLQHWGRFSSFLPCLFCFSHSKIPTGSHAAKWVREAQLNPFHKGRKKAGGEQVSTPAEISTAFFHLLPMIKLPTNSSLFALFRDVGLETRDSLKENILKSGSSYLRHCPLLLILLQRAGPRVPVVMLTSSFFGGFFGVSPRRLRTGDPHCNLEYEKNTIYIFPPGKWTLESAKKPNSRSISFDDGGNYVHITEA